MQTQLRHLSVPGAPPVPLSTAWCYHGNRTAHDFQCISDLGTLLCWSHKFSQYSGNFHLDKCFLSEKSFVRPEVLILGARTGGHWVDPSAFMHLPPPPG